MQALEVLQKVFGYKEFRLQQAAIIQRVVQGENTFVLMPTGGGKSLCYQIPALLRDGVGIIISPLIALMHDQVQALKEHGVAAEELNSSLSGAAKNEITRKLINGELDLLYVSPERIFSEGFLDLLRDKVEVALIAIDEAHCVSQWGHDFRPEYLQLSVLAKNFPNTPILALTATADRPTQKEIIEKLQIGDAKIFADGFDRPNIQYRINLKNNPRKQIFDFVSTEFPAEAGIIYCLSRAKTEQLAEWLSDQGLRALPYHAGMPNSQREKNQRIFIQDEGVIIVATIAFGMGIDKPNVRFVVHADLPKSVEAYYQETGRAGRDGLAATAFMLYGLADLVQLRRMIDQSEAPDSRKRIERIKLSSLVGLAETTQCRRRVLLEYFGEEVNADCGNCDTCLMPVEKWDGTVVAQKALSAVFRTGQRFGQRHLVDVLRGNLTEKVEQFQHQSLQTFAVGTELSDLEWSSVFRQLVAASYLEVDFDGYGALKLTQKSRVLLSGNEKIMLRKDQYPKKGQKAKVTTKAHLRQLDTKAEGLFQLLRAKRLELAQKSGVPPYVIFHDKTLIEIATLSPQSREELLQVQGIGESKLARYGEDVLSVVKTYREAIL